METIFYYFLKSSVDEVERPIPYPSDTFLGDIGDFICLDGVGYYITNYIMEYHYPEEEMIVQGEY